MKANIRYYKSKSEFFMYKDIICVRGAGDIATGVIQKLARSGYRVYAVEIEKPTAIRRYAALSTSMDTGEFSVEDITARKINFSMENLYKCWEDGIIPVFSDPNLETISEIKPKGLIDAILAKKNLGTNKTLAPITIALGPGFSAPQDVNIVIETSRGHNLGKMIKDGAALPNTGIPGIIGGESIRRVVYTKNSGNIKNLSSIGDYLKEGEPIFSVGDEIVYAPFNGILRGLITDGMFVKEGMKVADIDPRNLQKDVCCSISDKARCIGGAVLEAYAYMDSQINQVKYAF